MRKENNVRSSFEKNIAVKKIILWSFPCSFFATAFSVLPLFFKEGLNAHTKLQCQAQIDGQWMHVQLIFDPK